MKKLLKMIDKALKVAIYKSDILLLHSIKERLIQSKTLCIKKQELDWLPKQLKNELLRYKTIESKRVYYFDMSNTYIKKFHFDFVPRPVTK